MTSKQNGIPHLNDVQQQYEQLVASIDGIVWEIDPATVQFTFVSQQAEYLLGYPVPQWLIAGFWADHIHPDDQERVLESYRLATRQQSNHRLEYRMIAADGRESARFIGHHL